MVFIFTVWAITETVWLIHCEQMRVPGEPSTVTDTTSYCSNTARHDGVLDIAGISDPGEKSRRWGVSWGIS